MLALPDGYTLDASARAGKHVAYKLLGDEWQVMVYYKGLPAFELAKQYSIYDHAPKFMGRLLGAGCGWQKFSHYTEAALVLATQHRIGIGG
jgi:hypothetical protein